jgi:hypothetical protein
MWGSDKDLPKQKQKQKMSNQRPRRVSDAKNHIKEQPILYDTINLHIDENSCSENAIFIDGNKYGKNVLSLHIYSDNET